tara:strand:- start:94 stop:543 length:450 start_codon:yes stop_codon:yes gene_type:complete
MKSFKNYIREDSGFPTSPATEVPSNLGGTLDNNPSDLGNSDVLKRINAIVGQIGNHEYLVAEHAIERLRGSLSKIGLSFPPTPKMEGSSGSFDLPLERFGGRFGKDENTPYNEFLKDDGISHIIEGGLKLNIQYEMIKNSSCKVYAKIM